MKAPDTRGEVITRLRLAAGFRLQKDLAAAAKMDPATLSKIVRGRLKTAPEMATLERLARALRVPVGRLTDVSATRATTVPPTPAERRPRMDNRATAQQVMHAYADATREPLHPAPDPSGDVYTVEPDRLREAVYDALVACFADIFECCTHAQQRAAEDHRGKVSGGHGAPRGQRTQRG